MSLREVQALLIACHLYDIDAMVRVPTREKTELYRYLEDGAAGLMIPHVSTVAEARDLVRSTKFPPLGERGFDNAGLDSDYYLHNIDDYAAWAHAETFLTVQIETPEAVENVEDIAAVEGVDILFVGPGDLGYRYRHDDQGDADGSRLEAAYERIAASAAANGVAWACPASGIEMIQRRRAQGCQMIANGGDYIAVLNGLNAGAQELDAAL
jgi:2-keto-3-deoxy-L-rhamnonate aldolase RhmA